MRAFVVGLLVAAIFGGAALFALTQVDTTYRPLGGNAGQRSSEGR